MPDDGHEVNGDIPDALAIEEWPTPARRVKSRLCGCGKLRTVEVQIKAANRSRPTGYSQLGSVSRTLCEDCAKRVFGEASEAIKAATKPASASDWPAIEMCREPGESQPILHTRGAPFHRTCEVQRYVADQLSSEQAEEERRG